MTPEQRARAEIDRLLQAASWRVCDYKSADIRAARGVAIREFELAAGHGTADYLLYIDGKAAGVIEAKKQGIGLTATPSKQTFGSFNQNLVMEYGYPQAVAGGLNVNYDVYRIRTEVSEAGAKLDAGYDLSYRDKSAEIYPGRTEVPKTLISRRGDNNVEGRLICLDRFSL